MRSRRTRDRIETARKESDMNIVARQTEDTAEVTAEELRRDAIGMLARMAVWDCEDTEWDEQQRDGGELVEVSS